MQIIAIPQSIRQGLKLLGILLLIASRSFSQQITPLSKGSTISIHIDGKGKITTPPGNFSLLEGAEYTLKITLDQPRGQKAALWKYVSDKCQQALDKLEDSSYGYSDLYHTLWGPEFDLLLDQIRELKKITSDNDPAVAFAASTNNFSCFLGRPFLQTHLFPDYQDVRTNLDNTEQKFKFSDPTLYITKKITAAGNKLNVQVFILDVGKRFIKNYYEVSNSFFSIRNKFRTHLFYSNAIKLELTALLHQVDSMKRVLKEFDDRIVCDRVGYNFYGNLLLSAKNNFFWQLLQDDWLKEWVWYKEGDIALSPLGFTDEPLLPQKEGSVKDLANTFDTYTDSAINAMIRLQQLNESKINYKVLDSLLARRGRGMSIYTFKDSNQALIKSNAAKAADGQKAFPMLISIDLKVVDPHTQTHSCLLSFDGEQKLKPDYKETLSVLPTDRDMTVFVYNLSPGNTFTLKETPQSTSDQSSAITQLNNALDVAKPIQDNAASAAATIAGIISKISPPSRTFSPVTIALRNQFSFFISPHMPAPPRITTYVITIVAGVPFAVDQAGALPRVDLTPAINQYINARASGCTLLEDKIKERLASVAASGAIMAWPLPRFLAHLMDDVYETMLPDVMANRLDSITLRLTAALRLAENQSFITLPPKKFQPATDTSTGYRTAWKDFADQSQSVTVKAQLSVVSSNGKDTVASRKIIIKRAPAHWISASMGLCYIWNPFRRSDPQFSNGVLVSPDKEDQARLIAGLHFYPVPIILTDDRAVWNMRTPSELLSRFSFFLGVSFPQPLFNLHAGGAIDIWPGIKVTGGVHWYHYTKYTILNGQIADQHSIYLYNGAFLGFTIEPVTFVKLIGLVK